MATLTAAYEGQGQERVFGEPFRFGQALRFKSHAADPLQELALQPQGLPVAGSREAPGAGKAAPHAGSAGVTPAAMAWPGGAYYYLGTLSQALNASIAHLTSLPGGLALAGAAAAAAAWPAGSSPCRGRAGPAWFPGAAADSGRHRLRARTGQQQQSQEAQGNQKYWQDVDTAPGPGAYNLPNTWGRQGPAFSIAPPRRSSPGPGDASDPSGTTAAASDGSSDPRAAAREAARVRAAQQRAHSPGPGDYDVRRWGAVGGSGPAFSMGGRPRSPSTAREGPGPGEHQQLVFNCQGPAFSIGARPADKAPQRDQSSPGPGSYAADVTKPGKQGPAFTMSGRPAEPTQPRDKSPGPGEYQQQQYRPTGPAFTIPKRRDPAPRGKAGSPAPGDYATDLSWRPAGPAFSFGSAPPVSGGLEEYGLMPGPGEYYRSPAPSGPSFTLGARPAQRSSADRDQGHSPGPGEYYQPAAAAGGPAFTMAGRISPGPVSSAAALTPGPGAYPKAAAAVDATLPGQPAFTMGVRPSGSAGGGGGGEGGRTASPGPGQYDPADVEVLSGPAWTMGAKLQAPGGSSSRSASPGPGAYAVQPTCPAGPAFTIGTRPRDPDQQQLGAGRASSPGPGDYDVEGGVTSDARAAPAWTMGARREASPSADDMPGPGYYSVSSPVPSGPAFTMGGKNNGWGDEGLRNPSPGPGEYWPPLDADAAAGSGQGGPAFTMGARLQDPVNREALQSPGPGQYSVGAAGDAVLPSAPAFTMGQRSAGEGQADGSSSAALGPGAYQLPPAPHAGPAFSISGKWSAPAEGDVTARPASPGPGAYDIATAAAAVEGKAPAWTLGQRIEAPKERNSGSPAPGDYPLPALPSGAAFTMGVRSNAGVAAVDQELLPGPGAYTPQDPSLAAGPAFTIGVRHDSRDGGGRDCCSPGPGDYDTSAAAAAVMASGPAFTIAGRTANGSGREGMASPGPGEYDSGKVGAFGSDAPAFSITGKPVDGRSMEEAAPGPGAYEQLVPGAGPAFTLGGRPQPPQDPASSPGPGEYPLPSSLGGPAFTLGAKIAVKEGGAEGPSPGDYEVHISELDGPSFTMGSRPAPPAQPPLPQPGPGEYHQEGPLPSAPSAPAFTIKGKAGKGQTLKEQLLGPMAADDPGPGPGEHQALLQPIPGPSFSFAAPTPGSAGKPTLAQLQQKLAKLLSTHAKLQQQGRARRGATAAAGGGGGGGGGSTAYKVAGGGKAVSAGRSLLQQEDSWDMPADVELPQRSTVGSKSSRMTGTSSVHNSSSSRIGPGTNRAAGQVSVTRHAPVRSKQQQAVPSHQDSTQSIPAPGDYYSSSMGLHGPAYSMSGRAQAGGNSSQPGPGQYDDSKPFPHPLGRLVTTARPILKHSSSGGGSGTGAAEWGVGSRRSGSGGGQGQEGGASLTSTRRRVSWADDC